MKLHHIINKEFISALEKFRAQKLNMKVAFMLTGISKSLREEINKFEDVRREAILRLCDKDDAGNPVIESGIVKFSDGALDSLNEELKQIASVDVDVKKIKLQDLGDLSAISMSAEDLELLEPLFDTEDLS